MTFFDIQAQLDAAVWNSSTGPSMQEYGGWATFKDSEGNVAGIHSSVRELAQHEG